MKRLGKIIYFLFFGLIAIFHTPVDDSSYYLARAAEVIRGHWQIGNPYFYEHINDTGISFFLPDWLTAIPASFIIFPIITAGLIYLFLKSLKISGVLLYLGTVYSYLSVYNFIIRPTSLQTIYPFFILFITAVFSESVWFTILAGSITFYIYPYLWQIAVVILFVKYVRSKYDRRYLLIPLLIAPAVYYLFLQVSSPNYWQTMERIALVYTHIPTVSSFYYFTIMSVPAFFLRKDRRFLLMYFSFTALLFSNVITGKELETANHISRFIILFGSLSIIYLVSKSRKFLLLAFIWFLIFRDNFSSLAPTVSVPKIENRYVIFNPYGGLHLMSSDEVLERYLVSKYPQKLSIKILIDEFRDYAGTGPAIHQVAQYNYRVRTCRIVKSGCGEIKDIKDFFGADYFQKILDRYNNDIFPNINQYYQKYHLELLNELSK